MAQEQKHDDGQPQTEIIERIRLNLKEGLEMIEGEALIPSDNLSQIKAKAAEIRGAIEGLEGSESDRSDVLFKELGVEYFKKLIEFIGTSELEGICKPAENRGSVLRSGIGQSLVACFKKKSSKLEQGTFFNEILSRLDKFIDKLSIDNESLRTEGKDALRNGFKFIQQDPKQAVSLRMAKLTTPRALDTYKETTSKQTPQRTKMVDFIKAKIGSANDVQEVMQILADAIKVTQMHHKKLSGHYASLLGTSSRLVKELKQRENEIIGSLSTVGITVERGNPRKISVLAVEHYPGASEVCNKLNISVPIQIPSTIPSTMIKVGFSPQPLEASSTNIGAGTLVGLNSPTTTFPTPNPSSASTVSQSLEVEDKDVQTDAQVRLNSSITSSASGTLSKIEALSQKAHILLERCGEIDSLSEEGQRKSELKEILAEYQEISKQCVKCVNGGEVSEEVAVKIDVLQDKILEIADTVGKHIDLPKHNPKGKPPQQPAQDGRLEIVNTPKDLPGGRIASNGNDEAKVSVTKLIEGWEEFSSSSSQHWSGPSAFFQGHIGDSDSKKGSDNDVAVCAPTA